MTKWLAILALVAGLGLVDGASAVLAINRASVPGTYGDAMRWYRKSAEKGDPVAQLEVGKALVDGIGVAADAAQGKAWLEQAAQQGVHAATARLKALVL